MGEVPSVRWLMKLVDRVYFRLLGEKIRIRREAARLTQSFLEDHEQKTERVTTRSIAELEAGGPPRLLTLLKIGRALGIDASDLLKGLSYEAEQLATMSTAERSVRFKKRRKGRPKKK